ncbi:hypothetical protein A2U01_0024854, partial [Trifolium medium]|nr:hypothetical protein [Trifolium medium]
IPVFNTQQPSSCAYSQFSFLLHSSHYHRVLVAYGDFVLGESCHFYCMLVFDGGSAAIRRCF